MKRLLLLPLLLLGGCFTAFSQESVQYTDASAFPVYGKAYADEGPRYRRLPECLHGVVREALWDLGRNSAGLYIRFRTNAPEVHARWTNTGYHMPHMTDVGVGGLDLYAFLDGEWKFVGAGFDWKGARNTDHERKLVANMDAVDREYMLYLSLYDEVKTLEVGVPEGYTLEQPVMDSPRADAPVVMYGTSILQGGCATRAGMAHTNIIARRLDRTVINLGFSGNAHLDLEIARLMASVESASAFVLDYVPNASPEKINTVGEQFFRIIRDAHPDAPVIFVEDPLFPHGIVDKKIVQEVRSKNTAQKALFRRLQDAGEKNIHYLPAPGMTRPEDFVDGIHLTDLGMTHYADYILPLLKKVL